jgi:aminopeptidase
MDERIERYAELLVDCVDPKPGWQVVVSGSPLARPLLEDIFRLVARKGAYVLSRIALSGDLGFERAWVREAPLELLEHPAPLEARMLEEADALIIVVAPENARELAGVPEERLAAFRAGRRPSMERMLRHELPWVGCQYPTPALAQEAGMSTDEFADFLYGACLIDWAELGRQMRRHADRFDEADEVRILGEGTDLRLSLAGRAMRVSAPGGNVPGGEFFGCPVEDSAEGEIAFGDFPAMLAGREVRGIRLRFEAGRVVDASADANEDFLLQTLDTDDGARRLGELGIGCNPGITRYMRNTLFDEKIDGTIHLALGNAYHDLGGTNVSNIHWDIVKDLRSGGRVELDGAVVQENGIWLDGENAKV